MSSFFQQSQSDLRCARSCLNKHDIIQKYKQSQRQKSILKNKLNILQYECIKNQRKAKSIESSFKKINTIKQNYKKDKTQIQQLIRKNQLKQEQKLDQIKIKKEQSKGNLPYIKACLEREKSQDYLLVKKKSKDIDQKIQIYKNNIISERKQTAHKIKQSEQMVSFHRTAYFSKKQFNARKHENQQSLKIQRKLKRSRLQLQQMKNLQDTLLEKLDKSKAKLNRSMSRMSTTIRG